MISDVLNNECFIQHCPICSHDATVHLWETSQANEVSHHRTVSCTFCDYQITNGDTLDTNGQNVIREYADFNDFMAGDSLDVFNAVDANIYLANWEGEFRAYLVKIALGLEIESRDAIRKMVELELGSFNFIAGATFVTPYTLKLMRTVRELGRSVLSAL
ncbi:hypothetical protein FZI27_20315 [Cronobacter sakazakii]|nr:hypothetical protein FZI27_20315 [Cronobacter sakazakii]